MEERDERRVMELLDMELSKRDYVTHAECSDISKPLTKEINESKNDMSVIKTQLKSIIWLLTGSLMAAIAFVINSVLGRLFP